jgi:hypothetical protein
MKASSSKEDFSPRPGKLFRMANVSSDEIEMATITRESPQPAEGTTLQISSPTAEAVNQSVTAHSTRPLENSVLHLTGPDAADHSAGSGSSPSEPPNSVENSSRFEAWQLRSNIVQILLAIFGLIAVLALLKPQLQDHRMAELSLQLSRWTALKDYRDDCRNQLVCSSKTLFKETLRAECIPGVSPQLDR